MRSSRNARCSSGSDELLSCGKRTLPVGNSGAYDHRSRCANASPASSADLTRQDIIERTDGIPLFVEELTTLRGSSRRGRCGERSGNYSIASISPQASTHRVGAHLSEKQTC